MCVRPSTASYGSFSLDMDRSPGFGSATTDYTALFRLGFPSAPYLRYLTSPEIATRRTVLQKVRGSPTLRIGVPQFEDTGFQVLFHSPPGVLFTFPSQYYALSVTEGGPPCFPQGFPCPVVLWCRPASFRFRLRGFHPLRRSFPNSFGYRSLYFVAVHNPVMHARRFGLPPVRSPLLGRSMFLSFPLPT